MEQLSVFRGVKKPHHTTNVLTLLEECHWSHAWQRFKRSKGVKLNDTPRESSANPPKRKRKTRTVLGAVLIAVGGESHTVPGRDHVIHDL
jgi:hypothetical protein